MALLRPARLFRKPGTPSPGPCAADDTLAEGHTSLAFIKVYYDRDWTAAEKEFQRAIELNPNYANAHHWYAEFLSLVWAGISRRSRSLSGPAKSIRYPRSSTPGSVRDTCTRGNTKKRLRKAGTRSKWIRISRLRTSSSARLMNRRAC